MRHACGNEQRLTGLARHGRIIAELVLERALEHVGNFFARMDVFWRKCARFEIDSDLHPFEMRRTQIVLDQIRALVPGACAWAVESAIAPVSASAASESALFMFISNEWDAGCGTTGQTTCISTSMLPRKAFEYVQI